MGKKYKGIIYLILFIIALTAFYFEINYGNFFVLTVYIIQFADATFQAHSHIDEIFNKIND